MEKYEEMIINIIPFDAEDVITVSGDDTDTEWVG